MPSVDKEYEMAELKNAIPYAISPKGIVSVGLGGEIEDSGKHEGMNSPNRNSLGRVYIPDGQAYDIVLRTGGEIIPQVSGVAKVTKIGKQFCVFNRFRAVGDADVPIEPEIP